MNEGNHTRLVRNKGPSPDVVPKISKPANLLRGSKTPKCLIKIMGSRYNGTFLVSIDDEVDNTIYKTMLEIENGLESRPNAATPKRHLSTVFRCFAQPEKSSATSPKETKKGMTAKSADSADLNPLRLVISKTNLASPLNLSNASCGGKVNEDNLFADFFSLFKETLDKFSTVEMSNVENQKRVNLKSSDKQIEVDSDDIKKTAFIKFSSDDVLVIQPPKLMADGRKYELGLQLKPKDSKTRDIGQAIKLTQDKVLIDGNGVLRINENAGKRRSIHMTFEETGGGNPALKVRVDEKEDRGEESKEEKNREQNFKVDKSANTVEENLKISQCNQTDEQIRVKFPDRLVKGMNNSADRQWQNYRAHGAGEGWSKRLRYPPPPVRQRGQHLKFIKKSKYLTSSSFPTTNSRTTDESENNYGCADTTINSESSYLSNIVAYPAVSPRIDRLPYFVHSLVDYQQIGKTLEKKTKHLRRKDIFKVFETKQKVSKFASEMEERPKVISNDVGKHLNNQWTDTKKFEKGEGIPAFAFKNFEQILETLCGPNILYHKPELPDDFNNYSKKPESMVYDQSSQTETKPSGQSVKVRDETPLGTLRDGHTQSDQGDLGWVENDGRSRITEEMNGIQWLEWRKAVDRNKDPYVDIPASGRCLNASMMRSLIIRRCGKADGDNYDSIERKVKMPFVHSSIPSADIVCSKSVQDATKFYHLPVSAIKSKSFTHITSDRLSSDISSQRPPFEIPLNSRPRFGETLHPQGNYSEQFTTSNVRPSGFCRAVEPNYDYLGNSTQLNGDSQYKFVVTPMKRSSLRSRLSSLKNSFSRRISGLFGRGAKSKESTTLKNGRENIMFLAVPLRNESTLEKYTNRK